MGKINIRRHIGDILVSKGVVTNDQLQQALAILEEEPESSNRRLGQILFQDIGLNRHIIMREISRIYAFREVLSDLEVVSDDIIELIKKNLESLPEDVIEELVHYKAIPYQRQNGVITIAAADPSDPNIQPILNLGI